MSAKNTRKIWILDTKECVSIVWKALRTSVQAAHIPIYSLASRAWYCRFQNHSRSSACRRWERPWWLRGSEEDDKWIRGYRASTANGALFAVTLFSPDRTPPTPSQFTIALSQLLRAWIFWDFVRREQCFESCVYSGSHLSHLVPNVNAYTHCLPSHSRKTYLG